MRKLIAFIWLLAFPAFSATRISYSVIVSNSPVTSNTITLNGSTLIWSNTSASVYIPTNLTSTAAATTNLANKLASFPLLPPLAFQWISSTNFRLYAPLGSAFSASSVGGWAVLIASNQAGPETFTAVWPFENMAGDASNRVNQASSFVYGQGVYSTNAFPTNSTAVSNHLHKGAGPRQRVLSEVEYQTLLAAAYAQLTNANLRNSTNSGYVVALTNGIYKSPALYDPLVTNFISWGNLYIGDSGLGIFDSWALQTDGGTNFQVYNNELLSTIFGLRYDGNIIQTWLNQGKDGPSGIVGVTTNHGFLHTDTAYTHKATNGSLVVITNFTATNVLFGGTNIVAGSMAWARFDLSTLANGNNISVPFGTNKFIRLSGTISSAASICGIIGGATSGGQNGQEVNVLNDTGQTVTLEVNTVDPVPANRISTQTGLGVAIPTGGWCSLFYDYNALRWKVESTFPSVVAVTNLSIASGSIATNQAAFSYITNPIVSGAFWTNTTGQRVELKVNWTLVDSAISGFPSLCMTNISSGEFYNPTNSFVLAGTVSGRSGFYMSPGDYFIATNKSSLNGNATVDASFAVKQ